MAPCRQQLLLCAAVALATLQIAAAASCAQGECAVADAEVAVDEVELLQVGNCGSKPCPFSPCPPRGFNTQGALQGGFSLDWYISDIWYVQQQMVVQYLPADYFYCVTADYSKFDPPNAMGYDIEVVNYAQNAQGVPLSSNCTLGADIVDGPAGKLKVAPLYLPTAFAGPYWVVAFSVADGWALVSGGPPKQKTRGGCTTGSGINGSGLWILSRKRQAPYSDIQAARAAAEAKGFDLSVLKDVDQSNCEP
jgi:lipocalin